MDHDANGKLGAAGGENEPRLDKSRDSTAIGVRWFVFLQAANLIVFLASLGIQIHLAKRVEQLSYTVRTLQHTLTEHEAMSESDDYPEPGYLYTSWYSAGEPPVKRFCKTGQNPNENRADWKARHDAAVAEKMAQNPPI